MIRVLPRLRIFFRFVAHAVSAVREHRHGFRPFPRVFIQLLHAVGRAHAEVVAVIVLVIRAAGTVAVARSVAGVHPLQNLKIRGLFSLCHIILLSPV